MSEATVHLRKGREKSAHHHHPWIFSGAVQGVEGDPEPGAVVRVLDAGGAFLGRGHYSPSSQIRVRFLAWAPDEAVDDAWWRRRLAAAVERRRVLLDDPGTDACRLVHAEADLLPGLVVDRYGDWLVLQALTAGVDRMKDRLAGMLGEMLGPRGILERSDVEVRRLEGLEAASGPLLGTEPPELVTLREGGFLFRADLRAGQKTGFFLDQRDNRRRVAAWAAERRCLDCFAYSGSFTVHLAAAGACGVESVDSSGPALALAAGNLETNGIPAGRCRLVEADVFRHLRSLRDAGRSFDLVVLDPPRLAPTRAHAQRAARAYKDINLLALKLLAPGGILATFSCSAGIDAALFREIVAWAALDAGRDVQVLEHLAAGIDHPGLLSFPEADYLKGLLCRVA